ncbi:MAG: hypothetical protein RIE08_02520 [Acidimicrobiales bacterium]
MIRVVGSIRHGVRRLRHHLGRARFVLGPPEPFAPFMVVCFRPVVVHAKDWAFRHPRAPIHGLLSGLAGRPVHLLLSPSWTYDRDDLAKRARRMVRRIERRHRHVEVVFLAPNRAEVERLVAAGVRVEHVNQNAFSHEGTYRPLAHVEKRHDAIYDARLTSFKRHELAAEIASLALIPSFYEGRIDPAYEAKVRTRLAHAHLYVDPFRGEPRLAPSAVNRALNECRVGLALSAVEGSMFASIQYLLAGLPVVSTPSSGGRDEFFHPDYVRIVPPTPEAVAEGVDELVSCAVGPEEIRSRTLELVWTHRRRFVDLVDGFAAAAGLDAPRSGAWPDAFTNYLLDGLEPRNAEIIAAVDRASASP